MLFLVTSTHEPSACPVPSGGGPQQLIDTSVKGVKLIAAVSDMPAHTSWFLVEAASVEPVRDMLLPSFGKATSITTPVVPIDVQMESAG